jgi:hypothetical protein
MKLHDHLQLVPMSTALTSGMNPGRQVNSGTTIYSKTGCAHGQIHPTQHFTNKLLSNKVKQEQINK